MYLFVATITVSAFLLFQIQPMIAKMILPWFGGSASVWITAMLFYQTALLAGYLYAHGIVSKLSIRQQTVLHAGLLLGSLLFLPILPAASWKPDGNEDPSLRILGLLVVSIGLPYLLLSATSPLIQSWYSKRFRGMLPYRLFGLSNLASLLGLLAYPFLIEPRFSLREQSLGWSWTYGMFCVVCGAAAYAAYRNVDRETTDDDAKRIETDTGRPPLRREYVSWLFLSAIPSTLLLSVTNHLTQNVASVPFLWILPLSVYLFTFILVFDYERLYNRTVFAWLAVIALGAMAYGLAQWNSRTNLRLVIPVFLAGLFACCMFCHGELVRRKPSPRHLTSFYLMLSLGGAIGGLLVGFAAPRMLDAFFELPISLIACAALVLLVIEYRKSMLLLAASWAIATAVVLTSVSYMTEYRKSVRVMARNFYGGLRVQEFDKGTPDETRFLVHGTVTHGMQYTQPSRRRQPISYYGPGSGIDVALQQLQGKPLRVGVIGLGAGSLAAYAKPGDTYRFYEINPLVVQLAKDEFTFLSDCRGSVEIVTGDGRLSLERGQNEGYDLLVVDAFSGDAIPVHLLTKQALELYFRHLKRDGILALHITNTHLDLEPVVARLADNAGKQAILVSTESDDERMRYHSRWALLSSKQLDIPLHGGNIRPLAIRQDVPLWTDDYNDLFRILK